MTLEFKGIHHLTAVSANIKQNKKFFTETLGMRLVKRTVNQDDTSAYHLFYADKVGTPGTDITFFDFNVQKEQRGKHSITQTALRVENEKSLQYWADRFKELNVTASDIIERDRSMYLDFKDPEGQPLTLIVDNGKGDPSVPWEKSEVPAAHQIRGLGPITMSIHKLEPTDQVLQKVMNMRPVRDYTDPENEKNTIHVYEMGAGGPHAELHVAVRPELPPVRPGAGGVHHVAFRTPTDEEYDAWHRRLAEFGIRSSGKVDRFYFKSLYFREPNGILFEIATDLPGFAADESIETIGEKISLPPFLEHRREDILANLKPID